jgi:hypothetical protein
MNADMAMRILLPPEPCNFMSTAHDFGCVLHKTGKFSTPMQKPSERLAAIDDLRYAVNKHLIETGL